LWVLIRFAVYVFKTCSSDIYKPFDRINVFAGVLVPALSQKLRPKVPILAVYLLGCYRSVKVLFVAFADNSGSLSP